MSLDNMPTNLTDKSYMYMQLQYDSGQSGNKWVEESLTILRFCYNGPLSLVI